MANPRKVYTEVLSNYITIVLVVLILMGIMGILAIPYYISPITYSNGGSPSGTGYLVLGIILVAMILTSIALLERDNKEFGGALLVFSLIILTIIAWELYGIGDLSNIFRI
ncbi:hypothetical protein DFR86_05360 [Acidianus sulfidivorans JP7]|uniref:Uncharacterized protein n=1 Tax=Acidianus sulfidivorans JP7 TaxID=619593 RepID=A0A2U9IQE4_9CREN|nr:hypothetical protein [Acidianus sulfidivorans]AWR98245.1 hypothetical protein DFR86_05360 [Acidianus sulfidivorans JP7]